MKRFLMVASLVLVLSSVAFGERLPPVPMSDSTPVATAPQPPVDEEEMTSSRRTRAQLAPGVLPNWRAKASAGAAPAQAPSCGTAAQGPPSCSTALRAGTPAQLPSCAAAGPAQGPTCAAAKAPTCEASCGTTEGFRECSLHVRDINPVKFLVREFVQRPVYGVQKAITNAESRRLGRLESRLDSDAKCLACKAEQLSNKAASSCTCDCYTKATLTRETVRYANQANNLALRQAELEAKEAANAAKQKALRVRHAELFPLRD